MPTAHTQTSVQVDTQFLKKMSVYIDDQIAIGKVLQGEIDYLTGNSTSYAPKDFLHDLERRRNASV